MSTSNRRPDPGHEPMRDATPPKSNGHQPLEPSRPLRLPEDAGLLIGQGGIGEEGTAADDESEVIFLDDTEDWALLLPQGAILHAHGATGDDDEEEIFYECEPVEGADGQALARCTECGFTISEARLEELIEGLEDD